MEARTLLLEVEARRCGGVFAALLTALRRAGRGEAIRVVIGEGQEREAEVAISKLVELGLARVVERGDGEVVIVKPV